MSPDHLDLRYGCNPHQGRARLTCPDGELPITVLNGAPGYINILDALTAWQLVRELGSVTGKAAAASFKHVSPAGAAVSGPVSDSLARSQFLQSEPGSATASAYVRARAADRMSSFGDAAAVSERVDLALAQVLKAEVSDLVVAPAYDDDALELLRTKKRGKYLILQIDPDFTPGSSIESRDVFGLTLEQERNDRPITPDLFDPEGSMPADVVESLVVATTALKYTQSNSVCVAWQGQVIGMGAGQQSRIHCTRLACAKAEKWMLQTHPKVLALDFPDGMGRPERTNAVDRYLLWEDLSEPERAHFVETLGYEPEPLSATERAEWFRTFDGLVMSSDAFIPFRDNIDRAAMTGISHVAHTGGSVRDEAVRQAASELGITLVETGVRCFLH
ncbi:MAG: phosphoribosylaminoimidazolecarboxamide formyltransferase [Gemmatimonadota bacterium]|jgi:AICAR transformylase/IMP cyclohydrolase PurH